MAQVKFIDTTYLFKHTLLDDNIDVDLLTQSITQAQDLNIQQVLGNALYQKLQDDFAANNTLAEPYKTLWRDYIRKCQAEWTVYYVIPFINYRLTNKSVAKKNSEHSQPSDLEEIQYLREATRDKAEFYSKVLSDYLCKNEASFPEYTADNDHTIKPSRNNYFSGIYTGKSNKQ